MSNFLLHAFTLSNTKTEPLSLTSHKTLDKTTSAWFHFDGNNPETSTWLKENAHSIPPYIIDELITEETRPRAQQFEDGLLVVLRGVNLNENCAPEDMVSIRLWVEKNRIYSVRRRKLKAVTDIVQLLETGKGPSNTAEFISLLASKLFTRMESVFADLDERTDEVEEAIMDAPTIELRQSLVQIRKQAIMFKRYMSPQRDAIAQLVNTNLPWLNDLAKRKLQESYNKVTRFVEDLDAIRERAQIVKDELVNYLSDRMNKNMYVLSVIAALFLPLGFLTGLLGINVGGIPGADDSSAFMAFCTILFAIVGLQVIIFKKMKWF